MPGQLVIVRRTFPVMLKSRDKLRFINWLQSSTNVDHHQWVLIVINELMMIDDNSWQLLMIDDKDWQLLMAVDDCWRLLTIDDNWWGFMGIHGGLMGDSWEVHGRFMGDWWWQYIADDGWWTDKAKFLGRYLVTDSKEMIWNNHCKNANKPWRIEQYSEI